MEELSNSERTPFVLRSVYCMRFPIKELWCVYDTSGKLMYTMHPKSLVILVVWKDGIFEICAPIWSHWILE